MSPSKPERGNFANFYRNSSRVQRSEQTWRSAFWLVGRLFEQSLFEFFLALDAMARPGHSLETLGVDLSAAVNTLAETAFADASQSLIHHLQELPLIVALAEEKFFRVGAGRPIGNVLGRIFVSGAAVGLGTIHGAAQFLLTVL